MPNMEGWTWFDELTDAEFDREVGETTVPLRNICKRLAASLAAMRQRAEDAEADATRLHQEKMDALTERDKIIDKCVEQVAEIQKRTAGKHCLVTGCDEDKSCGDCVCEHILISLNALRPWKM